MTLSEKLVDRTIRMFFGAYMGKGIAHHVKYKHPVNIQGFGKFRLNRLGKANKQRSKQSKQIAHKLKIQRYRARRTALGIPSHIVNGNKKPKSLL